MPSSSARLPLWEIRPIEPGGNSFDARPRSLVASNTPRQLGPSSIAPACAHPLDQRPFAQSRLAAGLAEPGGDADDRPRAAGQRRVHRLLEPGGGDGDDHQLRRLRQIGDRGERLAAEHLAAVAVDQEDGPAVLAAERAAGQPVAPLGGIVGRAEDRHGARGEQRLEVTAMEPGVLQSGHPARRGCRRQPPAQFAATSRSQPVATRA